MLATFLCEYHLFRPRNYSFVFFCPDIINQDVTQFLFSL